MDGRCDCGGVTIRVPGPPEWVAECNCSICRRLGWLIAYYPPDELTISGETATYVRGERIISHAGIFVAPSWLPCSSA